MREPKRLKINNKFIIVAVLLLIVVIVICSVIYAQQNKNDDKGGYTLTVVEDTKTVATFSMEELKEMETMEKEVDISSTGKDDLEGTFTGVSLAEVLNCADKNLIEKYDKFIAVAGDEYSSAVSQKEVKEEDNIMVAYACDELPLGHFRDGKTGPLRLVISKDTYGNRSLQYLVKIICK